MTHSTHTCVCVQAIRVVCRSFLYSIHQSTGLKGIMKRLWTMSWDLELCVSPTMYVYDELCTACAFSDGCPKGLRYSVKKKVVVTDCIHKCVCIQVIRVVCRPFLYSIHQSTGLKGIMKRLWTMSWDLELCVSPTMYDKNEL